MKNNTQLFNLLINSYEKDSEIPFTIFDRIVLMMILEEFYKKPKNRIIISAEDVKRYLKKNEVYITNELYDELWSSLRKISFINIVRRNNDSYESKEYFELTRLFNDLTIMIEKNNK